MGNYINRIEFHQEMVKCKKGGELTKQALTYFSILSRELSKDYYFNYEEDRKDCIMSAVEDCWKYWRSFKESNVARIKFERNFEPGEQFIILILNKGDFTFTASSEPEGGNQFLIGETVNKTLTNFMHTANAVDQGSMQVFLDTVKKRITVMDQCNSDDLTIKSSVKLISLDGTELLSKDAKGNDSIQFKNPPNAFNYFTSVVRNGILKALQKLYPKGHKISNKISINVSSGDNSRFYNI